MRRVRYSVAMSLDGYIADPKGGYEWIVMDPDIDFGALFKDFDTVLIGRKSYEAARKQGGGGGMAGMKEYVFSKLELTSHRIYEKTGTVLLDYAVR